MSAAGMAYFVGVCFWALTAFYGVLSSQAFIQEQFLGPRLFAPVAGFADWHAAVSVLTFAGWCATRRRAFFARRSVRTWVAALAWIATTTLLATAAPLSSALTTAAAMLVIGAGVSMILLLALTECRALPDAGAHPPPDRSRADLIACVLAAIGVTIVHVTATALLDAPSAALVSDALSTLRLHLLLAAGVFLALSIVRGVAALTPRPQLVGIVMAVGILAAALATFMSTVVLASISIQGLLAKVVALGLGAALASAVGARGSAAGGDGDGIARALRALSPKAVAHWWGFALWIAVLLAFTIGATIASRTVDWNLVLLRSSVALSWLLALSAALTLSRRFSNGGAVGAFTAVVLFLGAHVALESSVAPLQAATIRNASGKWIVQILAREVQPKGAGELVRLLHANTNVPRDTQVSAVDVNLATLTGSPTGVRPHVFVFVIDSLRRDYLSPYNPAVTFTPGVAALAQDSLVFEDAFTQYGATGLSVPSIWVGGQILHKQYVTSFPRMNALAKLIAHEQYEQWISMDHILDVILPPADNRVPLDAGVPVKNHRACSTLTQIRSRLANREPTDPPVFAYSLPQDVHVSVVTSEGAQAIDDGNYAGFYAPVASRVHRLDECLGQFIDDLKARGLYEQSVIVLTADHGDSLGEEGRMGHAYSLHPEVVRVPLIMHIPPALRSAWTWDTSRVAYTTDITPTLYRLLGHEPVPPAPFFGEPLARPPGAPAAPRDRMVAASYGAVYGALLDRGTRYYVFDAVAMREMAFELGAGALPGKEVPVTPDVQERGVKVIRNAVGAIGTFYRFPTAPDSAP